MLIKYTKLSIYIIEMACTHSWFQSPKFSKHCWIWPLTFPGTFVPAPPLDQDCPVNASSDSGPSCQYSLWRHPIFCSVSPFQCPAAFGPARHSQIKLTPPTLPPAWALTADAAFDAVLPTATNAQAAFGPALSSTWAGPTNANSDSGWS